MRTTADLFQKQLHAYTITHAIEDGNVLRFHIDYFKPEGKNPPRPGEPIAKTRRHRSHPPNTTPPPAARRFNAILATASINDAIEYHALFKTLQAEKQAADPDFKPLNIACVFSPPAEGDPDVRQIQEDLPQEQADNEVDPEGKKAALKTILADYNTRYGTNHRLSEFDLYYQDVQKRIKDQQWPNADCPAAQKIDITIVVDMLLTGFDSKFLNTLYVDKNLKHHGLIQAFSRTNRVLNGTKPYGNILDFRQQQDAVDAAIALFSGEKPASKPAKSGSSTRPQSSSKSCSRRAEARRLHEVPGPRLHALRRRQPQRRCRQSRLHHPFQGGPAAQNPARPVHRPNRRTQSRHRAGPARGKPPRLQRPVPRNRQKAQRTAGQNRRQGRRTDDPIDQLDFEFVLFASAVIDYDYIMGLIAKFSAKGPGNQKMTREELIGLISADAKFMNERDDIAEYIGTLKAGEGLSESAIRDGYTRFKAEKDATELAAIAVRHGLATEALQSFVDGILDRMIFDGEHLSDLMAPLDLGWKARTHAELALMADLHPLLTKRAAGRDISGLSAYEQ
jgi:type I restriction enzyme, R subunit